MKITKRILSTLLAVTLLLSTFAMLLTIPTGAEAVGDTDTNVSDIEKHYLNYAYKTPEEKLGSMTLMYTDESGKYQLYADKQTGEVACYDVFSKNVLFTNPYDVATISSPEVKAQALSQIIIEYKDVGSTNPKYLYSFKDAAVNEQIKVQQIKKGIRVEYTIGREDSKKLVPKLILEQDFTEHILTPLQEAVELGELTQVQYQMFLNRYNAIDVNVMKDYLAVEWFTKYPCLKDPAYVRVDENGKTVYPLLYQFRENVNAADIQKSEDLIKKFTDYTYELQEEHHERTQFVAEDELYPAFKLALEYYADANGMSVRLPCNGLRYDMTSFILEKISVLPFLGAGNYTMDGTAFFPDGSGAIFDYDYMANADNKVTVSGKLYGEDYVYQSLKGMKYEKVIRYPVYGAISTEKIYEYRYAVDGVESELQRVSATVKSVDKILAELKEMDAVLTFSNFDAPDEYQRGFLAVIESGDSLSSLELLSGGVEHKYCTMQNSFEPKPNDTYDLATSGGGQMTDVPLDRKYTGSILIRYMMLSDDDRGAAAKAKQPDYDWYTTSSWVGMAMAYRDYLEVTGVLKRLKDSDVQKDIPLYLENFGALETLESVATMPMYLMTPLTTFDNVLSMYQELAADGVKNINFKLTGFANGGMYYEVPSALKWENAVGGKNGFKNLVAQAKEINSKNDGSHMGLYPDFDFAYIHENSWFDAVILNDDAVKSIDNRYTSYRQYSPTQQTFMTFYQLALSPSRYNKFYTELLSKYEEYDLKSISVGSLGTTLNSDFDEEDPYLREDSKEFTIQALAYIKDKGYDVMVDGGNRYTWDYVSHILNMDLDSSRYLESSASVPFIGAVLHGYVQFAGTPLNEEGDVDYAMLRAIENGSSIYFILSYQNTTKLKSDSILSQYYSIRYDIWKKDVVKYYNELNNVLKDVQTKQIIDHRFLTGERVLDLDELQAEIAEKLEAAERAESENAYNENVSNLISAADAWALLYNAEGNMKSILNAISDLNDKTLQALQLAGENADFETAIATLKAAAAALAQAKADAEAAPEAPEATPAQDEAQGGEGNEGSNEEQTPVDPVAVAQEAYDAAYKAVVDQLSVFYAQIFAMLEYSVELHALKAETDALVAAMPKALEIMETTEVYEDDEETRAELLAQMQGFFANADQYTEQITNAYNVYEEALSLDEGARSVFAEAIALINQAFVQDAFGAGEIEGLLNDCKNYIFDMETLNTLYDSLVEKPEASKPDNEGNDDRSFVVDNNRIVAVTYGEGNEAYKTFILNYNSYSVRVNYNGEVYTIESGEYIVVFENQNA